MIHGRIGSVVVDGLPFLGMQVEVEGYRRRLRRLAIEADAVVVVRIVGSTCKIDLLIGFRTTSSDAVTRRARMVGQLGPLNLGLVVMVNLAHPAFVGRDVLRIAAGWIFASSVDINDGLADQPAGMAEDRRSGNRRSLRPLI